jgi:hypothetical protein
MLRVEPLILTPVFLPFALENPRNGLNPISANMISHRFCYGLFFLLGAADAFFNFGAPLQDCVGDVIGINERVLVRMMGSPKDLTLTEIGLFETTFRDTYNILAVPACYGGSYMTITSVNVQEDFLNSTDVGGDSTGGTTQEFTLRVQITGTCRGCKKDSLFTLSTKRRLEQDSLYGNRGLDEDHYLDEDSESSHRGDTGASEASHLYSQADRDTLELDDLGEDDDNLARSGGKGKGKGNAPSAAPSPLPPCPDCIPPLESAFAISLNAGLAFLKVNNTLVNIDSVEKVTELDEIGCETDIVEFATDVFVDFLGDVSKMDDAQLRILEQAFLQTYNELNLLGDGTCDVFFRQIVDVQAELDGELNRRRNLQTSVLEILPFSIRFRIFAVCRNCDPKSVIFSFASRRVLQSAFRNGGNKNYRALQGATNDLCFCRFDAERRTPSRVEFQKAFSVALNIEQHSNVTFINSVGRALEVDAVECPASVEFFETSYSTEFSGSPDNLTLGDVNQLENLFVQSYNEAQERFCDPLFRTAVSATLIRQIDTSVQRDLQFSFDFTGLFTYLFRITGRCRFCKGDAPTLFGNDGSRRHRELLFLDDGSIVDPGSYEHRLQQEEGTCFCDVNFLDLRPPSTDEFAFLYDRNVQGEVEGVGNVTGVAIFITESPSLSPSDIPSVSPTSLPSSGPSVSPTDFPSYRPSSSPSDFPSLSPSDVPSDLPSIIPSDIPSIIPSVVPSIAPLQPTPRPTPNIKRPTNPPNGRRINEGASTAEKGTTRAAVRRGRSPIRRQH